MPETKNESGFNEAAAVAKPKTIRRKAPAKKALKAEEKAVVKPEVKTEEKAPEKAPEEVQAQPQPTPESDENVYLAKVRGSVTKAEPGLAAIFAATDHFIGSKEKAYVGVTGGDFTLVSRLSPKEMKHLAPMITAGLPEKTVFDIIPAFNDIGGKPEQIRTASDQYVYRVVFSIDAQVPDIPCNFVEIEDYSVMDAKSVIEGVHVMIANRIHDERNTAESYELQNYLDTLLRCSFTESRKDIKVPMLTDALLKFTKAVSACAEYGVVWNSVELSFLSAEDRKTVTEYLKDHLDPNNLINTPRWVFDGLKRRDKKKGIRFYEVRFENLHADDAFSWLYAPSAA